ncbi:alpha/beta hydrolase [Brachybacterium sp. AOP43-C2-M15]|uniref:alpha/beta hydrolase n=1 Tax=Brachybacterium sp. AOP43-C2-M15 TaxID=3457661 RepID=UPI004034D0AB
MSSRPSLSPSRRSLLLGAVAVAPLVAVGAGTANAQDGYRDAGGLRITHHWDRPDIRSVDFRVDTGGMVRTFDPSVRVTLPESYEADPGRHYPVLLMLHGRSGFYQDWTEQGAVLEQTRDKDVIVVMPDGGAGSFYSNANFPWPGREAAWESFIMDQALPFVHENFRTDPDRMAIAGLSMGGWGALALGQRYWGHFRSVSSYSGPADCNPATPDGALVAAAIWACPGFDVEKYWGTTNRPGATWGDDLYPEIATGYSPLDNIDAYQGKRVFLRTGDGPWDDFLVGLENNPDIWDLLVSKFGEAFADIVERTVHPNLERFSLALGEAGIENDFRVIRGATHDWELWNENFAEDLPGIMGALKA